MSDPTPTSAALTLPEIPQSEAADTDAEFRALFTDHRDGNKRLLERAQAAEAAGDLVGAKILREVAGTVMTLVGDLIAATGGALLDAEERIDDLEEDNPAPDSSSLLESDAKDYLALFDQYMKLLDQLEAIIPAGSDGEKQREIFETLRRLTKNRIEFTNDITVEETPDGEVDPDDDDPEDE